MADNRRQMRLYLLSLRLNPLPGDDPEDLSTVSDWSELPIVVTRLKELGLVSQLYSIRNLRVDLWYLLGKKSDPLPEYGSSCKEVHFAVLFRIIVQALKDLQVARPCDCGIWIEDESPDLHKCQADDHICFQDAEAYLSDIDGAEQFIGLPEDFLQRLVGNIKRDPIFKIESLSTQRLQRIVIPTVVSKLQDHCLISPI
jgi:hypothetical protein